MGDENLYQSFNTQNKSGQKVEDRSEFAIRSAQAGWDEAVRHSPLNRLRLLDARLARPDVDIEQVKARAAELVREIGAAQVLSDPGCVGLIRQLFGERGVQRLKDRAK